MAAHARRSGSARCVVDVQAPKRPSAAFFFGARAKMAENDTITFSNFSLKIAIMKIEASTRAVSFSVVSAPFVVPRRVNNYNL